MNIKNFWMMFAIAIVSICTISCGGDDDESGSKENPISAKDPEGTIIANLTNTFHGTGNGYYDDGIRDMNGKSSHYLGMNSSNNLQAENNAGGWTSEIVTVGKVNGLSSIKEIPDKGWTRQTAAIPGYGYVYRAYYGYSPVGGGVYARIYIADYMTSTSGGIMGITIKYQNNWKPEQE